MTLAFFSIILDAKGGVAQVPGGGKVPFSIPLSPISVFDQRLPTKLPKRLLILLFSRIKA